MPTKKVLILPAKVMHYRVDFYNALAQEKDLSIDIGYFGSLPEKKDIHFNPVKLPKFSWFNLQPDLWKIYKNYDVIVALFDFHYPLYFVLSLIFKGKFVWWGIGSGNNKFLNKIRIGLLKYTKAYLIVYMNNTKDWYMANGIMDSKIITMGNTVHIEKPRILEGEKNTILLLGTLNKRKRFGDAILAFSKIKDQIRQDAKIAIVGNGEELEYLKDLTKELNISNAVDFYGAITDNNELEKIFKNTIVSVSPGQAGLSILHCFAYGIPFIAYNNAISGGELENIKTDINGWLIEPSSDELATKLLLLYNNNSLIEQTSENALRFYKEERTIEAMVNRYKQML